jgi:enoyl-CoA hydratase/carnithine racemase
MTSTVITSDSRTVRSIILNRPERLNALNAQLLSDLVLEIDRANADPAVNAILFRGAGRAFCAGDDLKNFEEQTGDREVAHRFVDAIQQVSRALVLGPKVVVGAIHGWAVGGGLEWVINCDLPILAESTRCFFPELKWGMFPTGGATALLPRIIGLQKTRELMFMGHEFTAADALAMGIACRVVPDADLLAAAQETAEHIAALPQQSTRALKRVLLAVGVDTFERALDLETEATTLSFLDPETKKRVASFGR